MAYIISCSGRKTCPLQNPNSQPSTIEELSFNEELLIWRNQNIENHNVILDWNYCLPAWQLYSGRLYSQIIDENWIKPNTKVLIVSALFGLIKHTDLIPTYDLVMDNNTANFWRNSIDLNTLINRENDVDLLFKKYRKAFNNAGDRISPFHIQDFIGRGHNQGKWLNKQLNNL